MGVCFGEGCYVTFAGSAYPDGMQELTNMGNCLHLVYTQCKICFFVISVWSKPKYKTEFQSQEMGQFDA